MLTEIECPFCATRYRADVLVNTRATVDESGDVKTIRRVRGVRKLDDFEVNILESVESYLGEDMTVERLRRILRVEFSVCTVHVEPLVEKIKEAYGLYSPDGRKLCAI